MTTIESIRFAGIKNAREAGILDLPQKKKIPFEKELVADFLNWQISDLGKFQTLEQFENSQNLYARASMYTYGKGVEFALSQLNETPLTRIGYDFDLASKLEIAYNNFLKQKEENDFLDILGIPEDLR